MAWRALGLARLGHALAEADAARRLGQHRQRPCDVSMLLRASGAHAADRRRYATLLAGTGPAVLHGVRLVGGHGDQVVCWQWRWYTERTESAWSGMGTERTTSLFIFVCNDRDYCITYPIATSLLSRRVQNRGRCADAEDRNVPLY